MAEIQRVGDLELDQDLAYQQREWRAQRIGWAVLGLLIVAASLGLMGPGLFNKATLQGDGVQLEIPRTQRYWAPAQVQFVLSADASAGEHVRLWLSQGFLGSVQVQQITPQPESVTATADGQTYLFRRAPEQPMTVSFDVTTQQVGLVRGEARRDDRPPLLFSQFVFP